jgi:hypothetical protein
VLTVTKADRRYANFGHGLRHNTVVAALERAAAEQGVGELVCVAQAGVFETAGLGVFECTYPAQGIVAQGDGAAAGDIDGLQTQGTGGLATLCH